MRWLAVALVCAGCSYQPYQQSEDEDMWSTSARLAAQAVRQSKAKGKMAAKKRLGGNTVQGTPLPPARGKAPFVPGRVLPPASANPLARGAGGISPRQFRR